MYVSHNNAKRQYRDMSNYQGSNSRNTWSELRTIINYKGKTINTEIMSTSLPDELNTFYACFKKNNFSASEIQKAQDPCPLLISSADVKCSFSKKINPCKSPGLNGILGRALKVCEDQLMDVFIDTTPSAFTAPVCSPHISRSPPL